MDSAVTTFAAPYSAYKQILWTAQKDAKAILVEDGGLDADDKWVWTVNGVER